MTPRSSIYVRTLGLAVAVALAAPAWAAKDNPIQQQGGKRPCLQVVMPRILKPMVGVITYLKQVRPPRQRATQRDPIEVTFKGYNRETQVEVLEQGVSRALAIPSKGEARQAVKQGGLSFLRTRRGKVVTDQKGQPKEKLRKVKGLTESQAFGRLLGRSIGAALNYKHVAGFTVEKDAANQQGQVEFEKTLNVSTPLLVRAKDAFGRRYRKIFTQAGEINENAWQGPTNSTQTLRQSRNIPTYQAWGVASNILISAPVMERGADQGQPQQQGEAAPGQGKVTLFGLAAFPRGAVVKATNVTLGGNNTETITSGAVKGMNRSDRIVLNGAAGDRIRLEVTVPRNGRPNTQTLYVEVPRANAKAAVVAKRGKEYHQAVVQPEKITVDTKKLMLSSAYSADGRGPGRVQLRWTDDALSRGAVVQVTNLSQGNAASTVYTSKQSSYIELPGAMTDKLQVKVFYPGGEHTIFNTEVPMHKGRPALVDRGVQFYTPTVLK